MRLPKVLKPEYFILGKSERASERKAWSNIQASSVERRELSSYNSTVLTLKKRKEGRKGVRNLEKDTEEPFLHFLGSVCKLETVMNAVKCQLADMNGLSTE